MFYVYRFLNENREIVYIGKTNDIERRMYEHFGTLGHLSKSCYEGVSFVEYTCFEHKGDMNIFEIYYICKKRPIFNTIYNDGDTTFNIPDECRVWENYDISKILDRGIESVYDSFKKYGQRQRDQYDADRERRFLPLSFGTTIHLRNFNDEAQLVEVSQMHKETISSVCSKTDLLVFDFLVEKSMQHLGISWVSKRRASQELGCSTKTIQRSIKKFKDLGVIEVFEARRRNGDRRQTANIVRIVNPISGSLVKKEDLVDLANRKISSFFNCS